MSTFNPQPDIYFAGIRVQEPVTMLTDLLVSFVCYMGYVKISSWKRSDSVFTCFRYYFLTMAIATCLGGIIGHGFLYKFPFFWKLPGWLTSMFSITFIERASIEICAPLLSARLIRIFRIVNIVELLVFAALTFSSLNFLFVQIHSTYGLLVVVASLHACNYRKTGAKSSRLMLGATLVLVMALVVFGLKQSPSVWFNHIDISHMLMAVAAYISYMAVRRQHLDSSVGVAMTLNEAERPLAA